MSWIAKTDNVTDTCLPTRHERLKRSIALPNGDGIATVETQRTNLETERRAILHAVEVTMKIGGCPLRIGRPLVTRNFFGQREQDGMKKKG